MHVHIRLQQGSRGRPLGSSGQTTGLVKEQKGKCPSSPRPRCPSLLSKLHSMSSTLAVPICRASISALWNVLVSSIVVLVYLVSRSFDRAALLLGRVRLISRRSGRDRRKIKHSTHNIHIWYVLFDFKCPFIICSPLVRTAWRLPGSSAEEGLKRGCLENRPHGSGFKLCLLRFPEMWILWAGFGVPQQLFVATLRVRQFLSCLPRRVSSIPRGPVRRLHRTPPLHHLLPPLSSQDAFRYAGKRAPAAPLDVKHLSTDHLHLGASLPGTGISVFRRAQRASRLPCAPPPRYLSLPFYLSCLTGLTPSSLSYLPSLPVGPDLDLDAKIACRCSSTTSTHPHRLGRHPLHFFLLYTVFQSEIY